MSSCLCAFHAAFEATRFYNVSENSPLARELCDGPTCNEVESSSNQWTGGTDPCPAFDPLYVHYSFQSFPRVLLQGSSRPTSATTCSAVWRSSSLNGAPATGTVVMMGNLCAGQMGSSTRTFVRWRCLHAETGHASSRSRCPSVLTVRSVGEALSQSETSRKASEKRTT